MTNEEMDVTFEEEDDPPSQMVDRTSEHRVTHIEDTLEQMLANQSRIFARFDTLDRKPPEDISTGLRALVGIAVTLAIASIGFTITVLILLVQHILATR